MSLHPTWITVKKKNGMNVIDLGILSLSGQNRFDIEALTQSW